jgi:hypothetical protein
MIRSTYAFPGVVGSGLFVSAKSLWSHLRPDVNVPKSTEFERED